MPAGRALCSDGDVHMEHKSRSVVICLAVLAMLAMSAAPSMGAVDPDKIVFNKEGETVSGTVVMDLKDNNMTTIAYNVYDAEGDPIGTLTSWNCTGQDDVVNITEMMAGQTFRVKALKAGTAVLTVKARGDTKNMTASLTFQVKSGSTGGKSSSKGFIPGFGALAVLAAAGTASWLLVRKMR